MSTHGPRSVTFNQAVASDGATEAARLKSGDTPAASSGRPRKGDRARFQALAAAAAASSEGLPPLLDPNASVDQLLAEGGNLLAAASTRKQQESPSNAVLPGPTTPSGAHSVDSLSSPMAAIPQRSERYRTTSGSEVGIELDPQQAKVVEVYGFVGWIVAYAALTGYILWAYLPESVLHSIGVTYYPDRYWAMAAPSMLLMLVMFYTTIYGLIGMANNPHVDSFDSLVDGYSKHHVPVPLPATMLSSGLMSVGGFAAGGAGSSSSNMSPPITVVAPAAGSSPGTGQGQAQQLSAPARRNSLLASLRHTALGPGALPCWSSSLVPPSSAFSASSIGSSASALAVGSSAAALSGGAGADRAAIAAAMHRRWGHLAASNLRRWKAACRAAIAGGGRTRAMSAFASGSGRGGLADGLVGGDSISGGGSGAPAGTSSVGGGAQQRRQRRSPRLSAGTNANACSNAEFTGVSSSPDAESADAAAAAAFAAAAAAAAASRRPRGSSCPPLDRLAQHVPASSGSIGSLPSAGLASASKVLRPQLLAHGSGLGFTDEWSPAVATSGSSGSGLRLPSNSSGSGSGSDDSPHSLLRPLRGDTALGSTAVGTGPGPGPWPAMGGFKAMGMGGAGGGAFRPRAGSGTVLLSSSASVSAPAAGSGMDSGNASGSGSAGSAETAGAAGAGAGAGHGGLFGERARRSLGHGTGQGSSALAGGGSSSAVASDGQPPLPSASGGGHRHSASGPLLATVAAAGACAAFPSGRGSMATVATPRVFPLSSFTAPLASVTSGQSYLGSVEAAAAAAASVWLPSGVSKQMGTPDIADLPVSALNRIQFMAPLLAVAARRRAKQEAAAMAAAAAAAAGRIVVPRS